MEQAPRQVVALQQTRVVHRLDQRHNDRLPYLRRPQLEYVQDVDRELKHGYVVDVVAHVSPDAAQTGNTILESFLDRWGLSGSCGKAVVEGQRVEEHQTPDAQSGGAVLLLVGLGDDL